MLTIEAKGRRSVISTSKIKKITAIKKNRKEKGSRADPLGSNPHSNGEFFSRSVIVFFAKTEDRAITIAEITKIKSVRTIVKRIIFPGDTRPVGWKPTILYILEKQNINLLTSKLRCIEITRLHLQSVNTRQRLRIRGGA